VAENETIFLTTVTPVYLGELYLNELVAEIVKLRDDWTKEAAPICLVEAIFVVDAAVDNSSQILDALAEQHAWIKPLHLSRNFGQHPATIAGILYSSGDWIVTLDEDLQHHPERIPTLLRKAAETGADIVYANPMGTVHQGYFRDFSSRLYKAVMVHLAGITHIRHFNSFRLIRGPVARAAASVCNQETYFDVALSWFTERVQSVVTPLKDRRVIKGEKSGYSIRALLSHGRRMMVSTQAKALRLGAAVGALSFGVSVTFGLYILVANMVEPTTFIVRGWASLFVAILFFGGITAFLLGVLLEYITVVLLQAQGKPAFFVVDRSSDKMLIRYFGS
jgi:glycosyltransferase involved in cell wall biosynthesis